MTLSGVKALTFDTGGTILDWHTGFSTALAELGETHGVEGDWGMMANDIRRGSLGRMLRLGEHEPPAYNFDGAHRASADEVLDANGLAAATEEERHKLSWTRRIIFNAGRISHQCCRSFATSTFVPRSPS